jgi:hypothetical protein
LIRKHSAEKKYCTEFTLITEKKIQSVSRENQNKTEIFLQMLPTEFNLFVEEFSMTVKNLELISLQI